MQRKYKPNPVVLAFLSLFLAGPASLVSASTYGEDTYGGDQYSGAETAEEDKECDRDYPRGDIRITSISSGETHLKLEFEGIESEFKEFEIRWGTDASLIKDSSNSKTFGNRNIRAYVLGNLKPSAFYFMKIRALNGCAKGDWSDTVRGHTLGVIADNIINTTEIVKQTVTLLEQDDNKPGDTTLSDSATEVFHTLKIRVMDGQGNPAPGVSVSVVEAGVSGVTDGAGLVSFDKISSGWYEISAESPGVKGLQSANLNASSPSVIEVTIRIGSTIGAVTSQPSIIWVVAILPILLIIYLFVRKIFKKKKREQATF